MKKGLKCSYLTKIGIFSISAFVTALSVYIYSPIVASNATDGIVTHINAHFNPSASISIDTNELIFDISPTGPGVFESQAVTVTTSTNSTGGYELYFSSSDDSADMVYTEDGVTDKIVSNFSGSVTSESMPSNNWGYSLNNTDFNAIPTASNQQILVNLNHYPGVNEENKTVYVGTKISSTLLSGIYTKDLVFSALVHESPLPDTPTGDEHAYSYPAMQDFKPSSLKNVGKSAILRDARDGNLYTVKRLADGKVWMTENLRIIDKTISSVDSNLPEGETYTIPASSKFGFSDIDTSAAYYADDSGFYNHYTATAGWSTANAVYNISSPQDICPKGWRLPVGGYEEDAHNDFQKLFDNYNSSELMRGEPGFVTSGYVYRDNYFKNEGYYWSSTTSATSGGAYYLHLSQSVNAGEYTTKSSGYAIRCVAEERTLSDLSFLQELTPKIAEATPKNETTSLMDARDDHRSYSVKKLKDGNIWMLDSLQLNGRTLTSRDSNIPSGETWTVPRSSSSGFSEHNANNVYGGYSDETYYTFYAATAGWGTDTVTSGNSPKDICPKGWRLPTGGNSGEFRVLYDNYGSVSALKTSLDLSFKGYMSNSSTQNNYTSGHYWSSTVNSANDAYNLYIDNSSVNPAGYGAKFDGYNIRCIAK